FRPLFFSSSSALNLSRNVFTSSHETYSTGKFSRSSSFTPLTLSLPPPARLNQLGLLSLPMTAFHCPCVTSVLPSQKSLVMVTSWAGFSFSRPSLSSLSDPIVNFPDDTRTNVMPTLFVNRRPSRTVRSTSESGPTSAVASGQDSASSAAQNPTARGRID